jgi:hypothetical protein
MFEGDGVVEGVVVNPDHGMDRKGPYPDNVIEGKFIEVDKFNTFKEKGGEVGTETAKAIFTEEGRTRIEQMLAEVRDNVRPKTILSLLMNEDRLREQSLSYVDGSYFPGPINSESDRKLLSRARKFLSDRQTTIFGDDTGCKTKPERDAYNQGFSEAWDTVKNSSKFKDEKEESKPWYIKVPEKKSIYF